VGLEVAGSSGNKANLSQPGKLELGLEDELGNIKYGINYSKSIKLSVLRKRKTCIVVERS
jgi:hypothetical protein